MDLSLSCLEDPTSNQSSPRPRQFGRDAGYLTDNGPADAIVIADGATSPVPAATMLPLIIDDQWMRLPTVDVDPRRLVLVEDFISSFKKLPEQPLITTTPKLCQMRSRAPMELIDKQLIPKRSTWLAVKSKHREPKPEAQARKVMMKRLGVHVEMKLPDEASFDEFQTTFALPLSESTREAMQVLLLARKQWTLGSIHAT